MTRLFLPIRFPLLCRHDGTCQEAKISFDERQLDQAEIVERQFLVARRDRATLFQPAHTLLDTAASVILLTIIAHWTTTFAFSRAPFGWNDRLDPAQTQKVADALGVIRSVGG